MLAFDGYRVVILEKVAIELTHHHAKGWRKRALIHGVPQRGKLMMQQLGMAAL